MSELERRAKEKRCVCPHPDRMACAEELACRSLPMDDCERHRIMGERLDDLGPCDCCCHEEFFTDEDDWR